MAHYGHEGEWLTRNGERVLLCAGASADEMAAIVARYQADEDAPRAVPLGMLIQRGYRDEKMDDVRAEAGRRITARYPQWKQANMTAAAVAALAAGHPIPADIAAAWSWIQAVREESNRLENAIAESNDPASITAMIAGAQWPAPG